MPRGERRYYYECLVSCQMGYMATDQRRERWEDPQSPAMCLHERTFIPNRPNKDGTTSPDVLITDTPISKRYTEERMRTFKKMDLRTREVIDVNSPTTIKFRLLERDEIDGQVKRQGHFMTLRDLDCATADEELAEAK